MPRRRSGRWFDPAGWQSALAGLCAATGASGEALFSPAPSADGALQVHATAATQPSLDDYAAHWLGRAPSAR